MTNLRCATVRNSRNLWLLLLAWAVCRPIRLFSFEIVISVKGFILISLLGWQCHNEIRRQTAQAQVFECAADKTSIRHFYDETVHYNYIHKFWTLLVEKENFAKATTKAEMICRQDWILILQKKNKDDIKYLSHNQAWNESTSRFGSANATIYMLEQ